MTIKASRFYTLPRKPTQLGSKWKSRHCKGIWFTRMMPQPLQLHHVSKQSHVPPHHRDTMMLQEVIIPSDLESPIQLLILQPTNNYQHHIQRLIYSFIIQLNCPQELQNGGSRDARVIHMKRISPVNYRFVPRFSEFMQSRSRDAYTQATSNL